MDMFSDVKYSRLATAGDGTDPTLEVKASEGQAFSFESAFKYDAGPSSAKYRTDANFNSSFKYSGNAIAGRHDASSVALNIGNEMEQSRTSYGLLITTWVLTFLAYIFFVFTSPLT